MINFTKNVDSLKAAIREHSIAGYPLVVPTFGDVLGVSTNTVRELTTIVVEMLSPVPFWDFERKKNWSTEKLDKAAWEAHARGRNVPHADMDPLKWIHKRSRAILEDGYKVSESDIHKEWMRAQGFLDKKENVVKYHFQQSQVSMRPDQIVPGMIVEYTDESSKKTGWPGRVIAVENDPEDGSKVIYLETFEPVPALLAPKSTQPVLIEPSFVPPKTWVIGYGTLKAMKRKGVEIPPGMFDPEDGEKRLYFLDKPIPLLAIDGFCSANYPKEPQCVWQSISLMVLPIHPARDTAGRHQGGMFKPYPDDTQVTEIEAQIDYYGDETNFEEE